MGSPSYRHGRLFAVFVLLGLTSMRLLGGPRLDQIQVIGTHNSYHVQPHPSLEALIRTRSPEMADSLAYTHRPLSDQLERLGVRQLEIDVYADPDGGLFADPAGVRLAAENGLPPVPPPDPVVLRRPGMKVLHVPDFDYQSLIPTLQGALRELEAWSSAHPAHVPIFVLLELKDDAAGPEFTQPVPWTESLLDDLDREILEVLPPHRLVRPDDLRGAHRTVREAIIAGQGWPALADLRGRFVFLLDNGGRVRDLYLARSRTLADRVLFVSVPDDHPAAAWFKINDPERDFASIQRLVGQGFLVRTRADADTRQARERAVRRREAAFASGAQLISTDYPEPWPTLGDYQVSFTNTAGRLVARANPVSAIDLPREVDLEELAAPGLEPFAPAELEALGARADSRHRERRLTEASRDYARLLELEPAARPAESLERQILQLAPRLFRVEGDPFPLEDVVAIHHPGRPLIAFHLFWDDDIDFPEDNDPTDHEVVWVRYRPQTGRPERVWTYFHGRLLEAACQEEHPTFAVEWGKHGSLPLENNALVTLPDSLRNHWQRLHDVGIRLPDHPLARDWPKKFAGTWEDYRRFNQTLETRAWLEQRRLIWVSRWGNAVLDQHALPYNFAPKTEWPE